MGQSGAIPALRLSTELEGETDREALDRYYRLPFNEVHPGSWDALWTMADSWYTCAQELHRVMLRAASEIEAGNDKAAKHLIQDVLGL